MRGVFKVVGLAAALMAGSVQAGFEVVEISQYPAIKSQPAPWVGVASVQLVGVSQLGVPNEQQPSVKGFAKEVPLLVALKQIVPPGWHAKKAGTLDVMMPVSWKGGDARTWIELLHAMASTYKFSAVVDWDTHELTVAAAGWKAVPGEKVKLAATKPADAVAVKRAAENKTDKVVQKTWTLVPGKTLRENLEVWAKDANYRLSWAAVDYPAPAEAIPFPGELDAEGGPLYQIVEAYSNAEQPISISVLGNRIIRVENAEKKGAAKK